MHKSEQGKLKKRFQTTEVPFKKLKGTTSEKFKRI